MTTLRTLLMGLIGAVSVAGCGISTTTKDDVRTAQKKYDEQVEEAREAAKQADKQVGKEVREAEHARKKLEQTEADFASEQERKDYVERQTRQVEDIESTVAALEAKSQRMEGDAKTALDEHIDHIKEACNDARDKLDELELADVHEWPAKRDDVELAMSRAAEHVDEAQRIE